VCSSDLWDFQSYHMPTMFSWKQRVLFKMMVKRSAKVSSRMVVESKSVANDFYRYLPTYSEKVKIVQFESTIPESIYKADLPSLLNKYNLPEKYIYLPNQFWKHKNHAAVFLAVKNLKERGVKVTVVCSGNQTDYRFPTYFSNLFDKVTAWKIQDQIICLGMIPHEDVFSLMRQSICVLNASLFEGFGLSANEAKCLGKRVLLSDIPAHREQDAPKSLFFDPESREDLAEKMHLLWQDSMPGPDQELEKIAREQMTSRIMKCAHSFASIAHETLNVH
jgi:glycosyltransferase involved in cell wall biosynthesis